MNIQPIRPAEADHQFADTVPVDTQTAELLETVAEFGQTDHAELIEIARRAA